MTHQSVGVDVQNEEKNLRASVPLCEKLSRNDGMVLDWAVQIVQNDLV